MALITRDTYDKAKDYKKVIIQKGKPVLDAELNEFQDILYGKLVDYFRALGDGVLANTWEIKQSASPANNFKFDGGIAYLDGEIKYLDTDDNEYNAQSQDGVSPPALTTPSGADRNDIVYLDVWLREVDSVEDTNLKDPNLGIETAIRERIAFEIKVDENSVVLPTPAADHILLELALLHRLDGNANILTAMIENTVQNIIVSSFKGLSDTPANYVGKKSRMLKVNNAEDGLEFHDDWDVVIASQQDLVDWLGAPSTKIVPANSKILFKRLSVPYILYKTLQLTDDTIIVGEEKIDIDISSSSLGIKTVSKGVSSAIVSATTEYIEVVDSSLFSLEDQVQNTYNNKVSAIAAIDAGNSRLYLTGNSDPASVGNIVVLNKNIMIKNIDIKPSLAAINAVLFDLVEVSNFRFEGKFHSVNSTHATNPSIEGNNSAFGVHFDEVFNVSHALSPAIMNLGSGSIGLIKHLAGNSTFAESCRVMDNCDNMVIGEVEGLSASISAVPYFFKSCDNLRINKVSNILGLAAAVQGIFRDCNKVFISDIDDINVYTSIFYNCQNVQVQRITNVISSGNGGIGNSCSFVSIGVMKDISTTGNGGGFSDCDHVHVGLAVNASASVKGGVLYNCTDINIQNSEGCTSVTGGSVADTCSKGKIKNISNCGGANGAVKDCLELTIENGNDNTGAGYVVNNCTDMTIIGNWNDNTTGAVNMANVTGLFNYLEDGVVVSNGEYKGANYKFADSTNQYLEGGAADAWEVACSVRFGGTSNAGVPMSIHAVVENNTAGGGAKVRIIDKTNSDNLIGEATSGAIGINRTLISDLTLANLPAAEALWEIQFARLPSVGKARLYSFQIE